jgi:hypothetical protein
MNERERENEEGLVTEWNKIGGKKKSKIEECVDEEERDKRVVVMIP